MFTVCSVLFCALWHWEQSSELAHVLDPKAEDHVRSREADRDQATERAEKGVLGALGHALEGRDRNLEAPRVQDPNPSNECSSKRPQMQIERYSVPWRMEMKELINTDDIMY